MLLITFSGLPGTGKSTIARHLAVRLGATYLRIDTIEQALRDQGTPATTQGYAVAYRLAADNLRFGRTVIADSVNPLTITRDAWRAVATETNAGIIEVETICSDATEHRSRIETRFVDVPNLILPTWEKVQARDYEPWNRPHLIIDTATTAIEEAVTTILARINP